MRTLVAIRVALFGVVALAFPSCAIWVFGVGGDRRVAADVLSLIYGIGSFAAVFASALPLASLSGWTRAQRIESAALVFLGMSYATHLTWEFGWLVMHDAIIAQRDAAWTYPWWAYIDGGDARYASAEPLLLAMETLSVCNGVVGAIALRRYLKAGRAHRGAVLVMTGTAVVHLYSASLYYLSELFAGLPNVGTGFVSRYIKFGLANALWVVAPWSLFSWCRTKLRSLRTGPRA